MAPALQLVLAADSPAAQALPARHRQQVLLALRATLSGAAQAGVLGAIATTQRLTVGLAVLAV